MSALYKCLVVDDEPLAMQLIVSHVSQIDCLEVKATAENAIEALRLLKQEEFDLIFLDIQMPVLTGIELIRTMKDSPAVIFTTAYRDFAVESYELDAVDYLLKPITFVRFIKAVDKFLALKDEHPKSYETITAPLSGAKDNIYVNVNKKFVKVVYDDILYIESVKDYIHIHTSTGTVITKDTISDFEDKLPSNFIRIHRSFIVNSDRVSAFTSQDIEIGDKEIPIGKSYKDQVLARLK